MTHAPLSHRDRPSGFTLIEVLIVVLILAILAAIVVPQFTSATGQSRANALQANLYHVRQALQVYRVEHGTYPDLGPDGQTLIDQLTLATDAEGNTAAVGTAGHNLGPYLRIFPDNPQTSGRTIGDGAIGTTDWFYDELNGTFRANNSAADAAY